MTEQEATVAEVAEETPIPELEVPLGDRKIWVRMPSPEQILVWQRTVDNLTKAPVDTSWTGSQVMKTLDRLRRILDSIIVNRADVEWLDDEFLDGRLTFKDMAPYLTRVIDAFADAMEAETLQPANRAAKRAAKKAPAKKAARKAVPR